MKKFQKLESGLVCKPLVDYSDNEKRESYTLFFPTNYSANCSIYKFMARECSYYVTLPLSNRRYRLLKIIK